jgi:GDPmannose 4,6-dehydratase
MKKTALVTGYTGQDGTFLTKYLLSLGYTVVGLCRRISTEPPQRVRGFDFSAEIFTGQLILVQGDLLSRRSLDTIINKYQPDEVYNLAAQSHVHTSFNQPEFTIEADFMGVVNLLEALEIYSKRAGNTFKFYQASTSEMYGQTDGALDESSIFNPVSPYAIAKAAAHYYCRMKRGQGMFVANGILFNHESEIRGGDFVTQKIVAGVVDFVKSGHSFALGNLDSVRDWGYAGDYVMAMHMMLQHDKPDEFTVGTGETRTIRDFVEAAVKAAGTLFQGAQLVWSGTGVGRSRYDRRPHGRYRIQRVLSAERCHPPESRFQ